MTGSAQTMPRVPAITRAAMTDTVELAIATEFPDAEILIHQDPAGHEDVPEAMHPESPLAPTPPTA